MSDVFISYRRNDLALVSRLVDALRSEGVNVWWDQDIAPNAPWEETIETKMAEAALVLVAWSPAAVASENVKAEARWARRQGRLLQVFIETCEPPLFFGERQGVDLKGWSGAVTDTAFRTLINAISAALPSDPVAGLPYGTVLNGWYEVRRRVLNGRVYELYDGDNLKTHEKVAIKVFRPGFVDARNPPAAFRRDVNVLCRLNHEAIVAYRVLAAEPLRGALYVVTEFVDGISLEVLIGQVTVSEDKLRAVARRLADGLKHAHDLGVIHQAVWPDNILLPDGRLEDCKIVDFTLSRDSDRSGGILQYEAVSRPYLAPEQQGEFGREIGPWTDVFGLGSVIVALACGEPPASGATAPEFALPDTLERLRPVLASMLAADPKDRCRSMDDVLAALELSPEA
jgi:serine/threonine protein kinase